VWGSHWV
jgi:hypothetical protein